MSITVRDKVALGCGGVLFIIVLLVFISGLDEMGNPQGNGNSAISPAQADVDKKTRDKIKEVAKQNWPDDYVTQEFWIKEQMAAFRHMKEIRDDDKIKQEAQKSWPLDFVTQKFWYYEQLKAKQRLEEQ